MRRKQQQLAKSFEENPLGSSGRGMKATQLTDLAMSATDERKNLANKFIDMEKANETMMNG
ncbi:hypothetical protein [Streptomyces sp. RerS4]|uniref:hypothetical protein n=1 Tax=Streptomyces sp. RerS4 TaxID=2942449 RepID=UPI00201C4E7E|nr:hypothetical protein [Streptomyces sp. RerS4]UQW99215.1 hypothetical protein M4D82_00660 [Streptomyces sp. RerS4]